MLTWITSSGGLPQFLPTTSGPSDTLITAEPLKPSSSIGTVRDGAASLVQTSVIAPINLGELQQLLPTMPGQWEPVQTASVCSHSLNIGMVRYGPSSHPLPKYNSIGT